MIRSFKCRETQRIFYREHSRRFAGLEHAALTMLAKLKPIHPGEILYEEFLLPMGISQYRLARDISVPPRRINEIVHGKRAITADTALRLSRYFGLSERFWMNLQAWYDLEKQKDLLGALLKRIPVVSAA